MQLLLQKKLQGQPADAFFRPQKRQDQKSEPDEDVMAFELAQK
jgi:hypothetical protein